MLNLRLCALLCAAPFAAVAAVEPSVPQLGVDGVVLSYAVVKMADEKPFASKTLSVDRICQKQHAQLLVGSTSALIGIPFSVEVGVNRAEVLAQDATLQKSSTSQEGVKILALVTLPKGDETRVDYKISFSRISMSDAITTLDGNTLTLPATTVRHQEGALTSKPGEVQMVSWRDVPEKGSLTVLALRVHGQDAVSSPICDN